MCMCFYIQKKLSNYLWENEFGVGNFPFFMPFYNDRSLLPLFLFSFVFIMSISLVNLKKYSSGNHENRKETETGGY